MTAVDRRETIERAATDLFAERGYRGASIDEIARRSGVTPPVVYDHFASKQQLYERLLERHYAQLRQIWFRHAAAGKPAGEWIPAAIDAWFGYVEANRSAARMLFRDPTGDPEITTVHRRVQAASRSALLPLVVQEGGAGDGDGDAVKMAWETMRAVLQGPALWWYEHPHVSREKVVDTAMNAIWIGLERVLQGEQWS